MTKITFEDLPSTNTPLSASNLNTMQDNIENSFKTTQTNSDTDTYCCNYVNNLVNSTGWTQIGSNSYDTRYNKSGNVISVQCYSPANTTIAGYGQTVVGTLPSALKPAVNIRGGVYARGNSNVYVQINSANGNIVIFNWGSAITYTDSGQMAFCITFVL